MSDNPRRDVCRHAAAGSALSDMSDPDGTTPAPNGTLIGHDNIEVGSVGLSELTKTA